jgi:hypothetical protein
MRRSVPWGAVAGLASPPLLRLPQRPTITLWRRRCQAASVRIVLLLAAVAWMLVATTASYCIYSMRVAWAYRFAAATLFRFATRHRSGAAAPLLARRPPARGSFGIISRLRRGLAMSDSKGLPEARVRLVRSYMGEPLEEEPGRTLQGRDLPPPKGPSAAEPRPAAGDKPSALPRQTPRSMRRTHHLWTRPRRVLTFPIELRIGLVAAALGLFLGWLVAHAA